MSTSQLSVIAGVDIFGGLLIAGALAAWVPESWWQSLFLENHDTLAKFWGPLIGPVVAIISFVCSIGNVPLAAVLWNGGIMGLIPAERDAEVVEAQVTLKYTTVLNAVFLVLGGLLVWRYFRHGGGLKMLRVMNAPMEHAAHQHAD